MEPLCNELMLRLQATRIALAAILLTLSLGGVDLHAADPVASTNATERAQWNLRSVQQRLKHGDGRKLIKWQLNNIVLDEVLFDSLTLDEVITYLRDEAKRLDPLKLGVNFMYLGPAAAPAVLGGAAGNGVPANGDLAAPNGPDLPLAPNLPPAAARAIDLPSVIVNVPQRLVNMKLSHVLDAVAKTADQPINITINDYAVVIMPRAPGSGGVFGRAMRSAPTAFREGLSNATVRTPPVVGVRGNSN